MKKNVLKTLMACVLTGALAAGMLTGCSGGKNAGAEPSAAGSEAAKTEAEETTAAAQTSEAAQAQQGKGKIVYLTYMLGDMSFGDSGEAGMQILKEQGYEEQTIETGEDSSRYDAFILDALDAGCDYMIGSNNYQENIEKIADQYPDTKFIIFDVTPDTEVKSDNILYIAFKQNEAAYLGGIVAAGLSKNGSIGTVGGVENSVIYDFMVGYIEGARAYKEDVKVSTAFIGDWSNSAKMLELCTQQNKNFGTDVFFPVAGGAGTGAYEAAGKLGEVWTIGVDADQHEVFQASGNSMADVIVTSVLKEVGNTMVELLSNPESIPWGTLAEMGLKEGAVGLAENEYYRTNVPEEVQKAVEEATEGIRQGNIKVDSYFTISADEYEELVSSVAP